MTNEPTEQYNKYVTGMYKKQLHSYFAENKILPLYQSPISQKESQQVAKNDFHVIVNPSLKTAKSRNKFIEFGDEHQDVIILPLSALSIALFIATAVNALFVGMIPAILLFITALTMLSFIPLFKMTIKPRKNVIKLHKFDGEWSSYFYNVVDNLKDVQYDCEIFKATAAEDAFLENTVTRIDSAAKQLEWEIACYWVRIRPYIRKGTEATSKRIQARFKEYTLQVDQFKKTIEDLTDTAFRYNVVEKSENHIKILQQEIKMMMEAIEEAYTASQLALESGEKKRAG